MISKASYLSSKLNDVVYVYCMLKKVTTSKVIN